MENYVIILVDGEPSYAGIMEAILRPFGAVVDWHSMLDPALAAARHSAARLILIDPAVTGVLPEEAACPIIAFADRPPDSGFDGWLPKSFTATALRALFVDAVGMEAQHRAIGEGAQLAELLGAEQADAMIDRLHQQLTEAVKAIDAGGDPSSIGHRIGGLAGILGFPILSTAWLALQDATVVWPVVRRLTIEAIAQHGPAE